MPGLNTLCKFCFCNYASTNDFPHVSNFLFEAINGGWSPWEEWSQPLPGKTTVQRNRFCNNPAPDFGGSSCEGPDSQTKEVILRKMFCFFN